MDELLEFNKNTLEVLRMPLEDKKVKISRLYSKVEYPCNFMLVASMNPCPCGYYGSQEKQCRCSATAIEKYLNKLSGPLLDRIDIQIEVQSIKFREIESTRPIENSETIRKRVNEARRIQQLRYKDENIYSNSELTTQLIEKYCKLDNECKNMLEDAFNKLKLSARAYDKILKVSRTIADLDKSENIKKQHLLEAIQYRSLDRKYWNKNDN